MKFSQPTPELPVPNVEEAQAYYRDHLGFEIAWTNDKGRIGAVRHGDCAVFFRETLEERGPAIFWVYVDSVDDAYADLAGRGANISDGPSDMPWGLRQFTVKDPYGNIYYFFNDG